MSLEEKVMKELKSAMLAKDEKSMRSLRAIKAAIINAKTAEGAGGVIKEDDEIKLLQKLVKQRRDSLAIFEQQNRDDLAKKEKEEIEIIEKFLPRQLETEELKRIIAQIIKENNASPAEMGKIIGIANKQLVGKADGKTIAGIVKELLASPSASATVLAASAWVFASSLRARSASWMAWALLVIAVAITAGTRGAPMNPNC